MKSSLPVLALLCALSARAQTNPIARENALPGAPESEWTITGLNQATAHEIEGYPWPLSVSAGRAITLYVNSTYALNKISVYRLGWYQGLGARRVFGEATFSGIAQPPPRIDPTTGLVDCSTWLPSFTFGTSTNGVP